jgi:hypothetical protein
MINQEALQHSDELQQRLHSELGFTMQEGGEWLISDDFQDVGGVEKGEVLPSRTRVSADGTRFELGCRIEDIQGLLALSKLNNPNAKGVEAIREFWPDTTHFVTTEEAGYIFIGSEIDPTPDGLEKGYYGFWLSYDIALEAAQRGLTYEEMLADKWRGDTMRLILQPRTDVRDIVFERSKDDDNEADKYEYCESGISVDNLREFPLATYETSWHFPGTLTVDGQELKDDNIWLIGHNRGAKVDLHFSQTHYDNDIKGGNSQRYSLSLTIPEGVTIETVNDMVNLKQAVITKRVDDGEAQLVELVVNVMVEDNDLAVESEDGTFKLELRTPICEDCHKPEWKFRWPSAAEFAEQELGMRNKADVLLRNAGYGGSHGYQAYLEDGDGTKHEYCIDHITDAEQRYVESHPFASRAKAQELARKTLDELGYGDVEVDRQLMHRALGNKKGWWVYPTIKYERNGKEITRYIVGDQHHGLVISDDGEVQPLLPSREYVDFRA